VKPYEPIANPLIGDRTKRECELLRLVREIADDEDADPAEVIAQLSEHRGHSQMNPAAMSDDRLLHTLRAARKRAGNGDSRPVLTPEQIRAVALDLRRRGGELERPVEDFLEQAEAMLMERVR